MRPLLFAVPVALILGMALASAPRADRAPREGPSGEGPGSGPLHVLFVGNSYTYYHNVPELVEAMARELDGPRIRTGAHTHGGYTLRGHLRDGHVAELLARGPDGGGTWDRVVLQEQSQLGVEPAEPAAGTLGDPAAFLAAAEALGRQVEEAGARPLLYMTWARQRFPDQVEQLEEAYARAGERLGAPVAPVGLAWDRVRRERPDLVLFRPDGSHPSAAGSYLAACVLYASLAGRSPVGAPGTVRGSTWDGPGFWAKLRHLVLPGGGIELVSLDREVSRYLQRVAWEVVEEWRDSGR